MLEIRGQVKASNTKFELVNLATRIYPTIRTFEYMKEQKLSTIFFGEGLGTWGTIAVRNNLDMLVNEEDANRRSATEFPVFIFELGLVGVLIFLLDLLHLYYLSSKVDIYLKGALLLFLGCIFLYPMYKFMMYMVYYFILRRMIINKYLNNSGDITFCYEK